MTPLFVYITCVSLDEAKRIGRALVEVRLCACVNILPGMTSLYWWQRKIEEGHETVLIAKTRDTLLDALTAKVKSLHSYACPCVVAFPVTAGNDAYVKWIEAETEGARS
ncbi:MAG: divalent-cation tolerance protein CutA [Alphaproteobacteria bacterium]|nr:divalent-cation tolerance protein CutA [Alphaproteobacteria bacterium]